MEKQSGKLYDVIVIGGGPGGVSTALYAARGGLSVLLLHTGISALHRAERIQNYFGSGEVSGKELYERGLNQARAVGVTVLEQQVTFVRADEDRFTVTAAAGEYNGSKLVLAVGAARKSVVVEGIAEYEGRGVSYCAVCDAFFYRKKRAAVIGAGDFARHEYETLSRVAGEVFLLTDGEAAPFEANTVTKKIKRIVGGDRVTGVEFEDGEVLEVDGVFVAVGTLGAGEIAKSVGIAVDKSGAIKADEAGRTNVPGLYAVGDCTAGVKQIATAVFGGMTVGLDLVKNAQNKRA